MNQVNSIVLAGSGRSGTTWLGNIISANPNIGIIFEPFNHRKVEEAKDIGLFTYAHADTDNPALYELAAKIFTGKISNDWVNQQQRRTHFLVNRFLVKAIRANLMLPWLEKNFDADIVFTIRHPCAVILSRQKIDWTTQGDHFLKQDELVERYLHPHLDFIHDGQADPVTQHAIIWCLENLIPLKQIQEHNWALCMYEDMVQYPRYESKKILSHLKIMNTPLTRRAITKVSRVTGPESAVRNGKDLLSNWQSALAKDDVRKILNVLEHFEIGLYNDTPLPNKTWLFQKELKNFYSAADFNRVMS